MHSKISIERSGKTYWGRRYLRLDGEKTYQTIFYQELSRCDRIGYARFDDDDPAMNAAAAGMLAEMVEFVIPEI
jgi:hypothetical protein